MGRLVETDHNLTITKLKWIWNNYKNYGKIKVTSSSGIFNNSITIEVIYCYFETKTKKF